MAGPKKKDELLDEENQQVLIAWPINSWEVVITVKSAVSVICPWCWQIVRLSPGFDRINGGQVRKMVSEAGSSGEIVMKEAIYWVV